MTELDDSKKDWFGLESGKDGCARVGIIIFMIIFFVFTCWFLAKINPDNPGNWWDNPPW
jgi:hypothetical protein